MGALKEKTKTESTKAAHILIMEDDLNVARGLKMVLDEQGYDVDLRDTGYGALDAIGQYEYDLLMADLRLPDIDGMQVIKQVRQSNPETGVIVMTGYATSALAVDALKLGASDFIAKPFTEDQIKASIDEALLAHFKNMETAKVGSQSSLDAISIQKREVLKVLNRTSEDRRFSNNLMKKGGDALWEYTLSNEAKAAIGSGDLGWINKHVGELTQKQLMYVYKRLELEVW
ncbi:sensory histidine kinase [Desulforapulum autotrophicum HRM2]|uniref:Sensory histidine kinase n=1 Tax=Desulforapulum autotrophicum (strain ATCC 43914 / DSM 3382 / VKM B-1955 / HRM2) TaxID=177437 RepID=C0QLY8_DESAH|nr:response regulator [Desulforapulum autotrophicum]ACN14294.1 sensory histidine kinase [Desulforapulum autotrophicum HRM2]